METQLTYYIIYSGRDKGLLAVLDLGDYESHELSDWPLASRKSFHSLDEAVDYAKKLAHEHHKIYEGFLNRHGPDNQSLLLD